MDHQSKSLYSENYETLFLKFLGNTPQLRIINFFMDNPLLDFTKKEVMESIGMAKRTLYEYFSIIEKNNIVIVSRKIGKAKLYKLNKKSELVKKMREMENILSNNILEREGNLAGENIIIIKEEQIIS